MHKLQAHTHTGAIASNVEKGKLVTKGYICVIPWYGGQADQNEIWVFRDQGAYLGGGRWERQGRGCHKSQAEIYFCWRKCERKGICGADNILLLDLSGG